MFKKFANLLGVSQEKPSASIQLAAFGKHPGWLDHMEEIGLNTDRLIALRRMLYSEGINRNIDSGTWTNLDESQSIDTFKHLFLWRMGDDYIIGRLWSSTDGRGRSLYPMVLSAHCKGIPIKTGLRLILPRLEQLESQLVSTNDSNAVRLFIKTAQTELLGLIKSRASFENSADADSALGKLADSPDLGPDRQGLYRVIYQVEQEMGDPKSLRVDSRSGVIEMPRTQLLRVPKCVESESESLGLWAEFIEEQFGAAIPMLLLLPLDHPWLDAILGEPSAAQLFCLRASLDRTPLSSSVPYNLPDEFISRIESLIEKANIRPGINLVDTHFS